jgi:hypothetical protein
MFSSDFSNALEILFCLPIFTHFVGAGPLERLFFKPHCKKVDGKLRQQGVVIGPSHPLTVVGDQKESRGIKTPCSKQICITSTAHNRGLVIFFIHVRTYLHTL